MTMMTQPRLDRRVTLETFTGAQDTTGFTVKTWELLATVWAEMSSSTSTRAEERITGDNYEIAERTMIFTIRYRSDLTLTAQHRLRHRGDTFRIAGIQEVQRRQYLKLTCIAEVG